MLSIPEQNIVKLFYEILEKNIYNFDNRKEFNQLESFFTKKIENIKDVNLNTLYKYKKIYEYILQIHKDNGKLKVYRTAINNINKEIDRSKLINIRIFHVELIILLILFFIGAFILDWGFGIWMFITISTMISMAYRIDSGEWKTFLPNTICILLFLIIASTFFIFNLAEWRIYLFTSFIASQFIGSALDTKIRGRLNYIPDNILNNYSFDGFYSSRVEPYITFFRKMILCDENRIESVIFFLNEHIEKQLFLQNKKNEELKLAAQNRERIENIKRMNPYEFEVFMAEIFNYYGFSTKITKKSGDDGIDIFLWKGEEKMAVQCKRQKGNVGTPSIRNFIGSMQFANVKKGFFVTTGNYSLETIKMIKSLNYELILIDIGIIEKLIETKNNSGNVNDFNAILEEGMKNIKSYADLNLASRREGQEKYKYLQKYKKRGRKFHS